MDLLTLATQLGEAFPAVPVSTRLKVLGEGFGSLVVETGGGIVFAIAKNELAQHGPRRERLVLPVIKRHVSGLRVPEVTYYLDESDRFRYGVIGYEKLPGRPLSPRDVDQERRRRIAGQVAEFLTSLHGIDIDEVCGADLPEFPPSHERLGELWQSVSAYLEQCLSRSEYEEVQRWHEGLLDYGERHRYASTLVHGDFWYENMLFDDEQGCLVGILDFESVAIGDPAIDLATQRYLGNQFAQLVIDGYYRHRVPNDLNGRIKDLMGLRELVGLEYGIKLGNVDEDALGKVKRTILSSGEPDRAYELWSRDLRSLRNARGLSGSGTGSCSRGDG